MHSRCSARACSHWYLMQLECLRPALHRARLLCIEPELHSGMDNSFISFIPVSRLVSAQWKNNSASAHPSLPWLLRSAKTGSLDAILHDLKLHFHGNDCCVLLFLEGSRVILFGDALKAVARGECAHAAIHLKKKKSSFNAESGHWNAERRGQKNP